MSLEDLKAMTTETRVSNLMRRTVRVDGDGFARDARLC